MEMLKRPLADYLRHRIGPDVEVLDSSRFPRGSSRLTWFVDYRRGAQAPVECLVFRGDFAGGSTIHSQLDQEYFIYSRLAQTAVPVARPLWWEDDPDWAPRPFYVRERIDGDWSIPGFHDPDPSKDALRIEISREHMRKLALVHAVDWKGLGFDERLPAPSNPAECGIHFLDRIMAGLREYQVEPIPLLTEAVVALRARAPVAPRVSLCKGTNGLGEEVFRDGRIVAMSDWEEASIGDPAADFASLQDFVPEIERDGINVWGLQKALDYYASVGGCVIPIENVRFYQSLRMLGTVLFGHRAAVITHGKTADIRKPWTGIEPLHVGKRILAHAIGIGEPISAMWFQELNETVQ